MSELVEHLIDMLEPLGAVQAQRFFGGHGLKLEGAQFAFVIKGRLWLRVDAAMAAELEGLGCEPFSYAKAGKTVRVSGYRAAPAQALEDAHALRRWASRAWAAARAAQ